MVAGELSGSAAVAVWAVAVPKGSPGSALSGIAVFYCGTLLAFSRPAAVIALQLINLNTSTHFYNVLMFCRLDSSGCVCWTTRIVWTNRFLNVSYRINKVTHPKVSVEFVTMKSNYIVWSSCKTRITKQII